ncbi:C4-dicarboxylate ABC transporter [Oceanicola sp. 22II-s10i]|uniref:sensor histidine kinase n=1 Tax=Oceanicola sp. 22II-s10i TaxID=1317116 RepID=UPI000B528E3C|nr:ATP-binding protein [Oceanicola sp. 22II-s10i]OWU84434.1 C4-dicarboxylate ABC transporter [Oceanicola sp. 22II-s10i]
MIGKATRRAGAVLAVVAAVALVAAGVWRYGYDQALDGLARRGEADLALASDRLTGQLQRYRDLAVLMAVHPELTGPRADEVLQHAADRTSVLNIFYLDGRGRVQAAAHGSQPEAEAALIAGGFVGRAFDGALGTGHGIDPSTGLRAFYVAAPRFFPGGGVQGALVVAVDVEALEREWRGDRPAVFFTDEVGEVFISNRSEILFWRRSEAGLQPSVGEAMPRARSDSGGHEVWRMQWGPYLPAVGLHIVRDLPTIDMRAEALVDVAPARRLAWLQAAVVGLVGLVVAAILFWAMERRRVLAVANATLESRVMERTTELSGAIAALRREVAERQEAEAALKKAQADLVQAGKLSALGQMSAGLSHELNQPLMAISQFAENGGLFLERGKTDAAAGNLRRIAELAGRMGRIIRNLRAFARQENEPVRRIDVVAVVETALEMTEARLAKDGVILEWERPGAPVWAMGGEVRLGQVMVNLIANAADAMSGGEMRKLSVVIEAAPRPVIRVRDTGPGIAAPEKIFDPFYSTKEVGASEGMGLGLSISYGLVQSFGGAIRGQNAEGGGAEFTVELEPWRGEQAA